MGKDTAMGRTRPAPLSSGIPKKFRKTQTFLTATNILRLDQAVMVRRAKDEDRDEDGERIQVNRSLIIRELIDKHLPLDERFQLGQD